jgi:Zn-dependent peptidase ImmA (M78 family)
VIAHELGHAVCDHYFLVIPPEKVREMLASYVDAHLEE